MKKKLLYLTSIVLFSAASINAQTWDFSTAATTLGTVSSNNSATIAPDVTNTATSKKFGPTYNTGTAATILASGFPGLEFGYKNSGTTSNIQFLDAGYFQAGGKDVFITIIGCTAGQNIAVQYSAKGATAAPVQAFADPSGAGASAAVVASFPSNCTVNTTTTTATTSTGTSDIKVVNLTVTADGNVNLVAGTPAFRIYKIVKGGTLGTNSFSKESDITVYSKDNKVLFSNIKSKTNVAIYSLTGSLVKSADINEDSGLDVKNGVYIVKLQSEEGEKTVKVIVQ
ncbi:T9SS type A sorting domain-containing protein [Flavobacterium sp. WC2509]|uniref:T9SS type A sorting domain-containing protein n=1 Tax=Flavobacterium sp. WC2509 TaxID=3461406 RepID=UPI004044EF66